MKKEDAAKKLLEEQEKIKKIEEEMQINSLGVEPVVVGNNLDMLPADANQVKN